MCGTGIRINAWISEMNIYKWSHLGPFIFRRASEDNSMGKKYLLNKLVLRQLDTHMKRIKLDLLYTTYTKINSKMDLRSECKI